MKSCVDCKYAQWDVTKSGKLHPSGDGKCLFPWEMPKLPASMYWLSGEPQLYGGRISRRRVFKTDCVYFNRE